MTCQSPPLPPTTPRSPLPVTRPSCGGPGVPQTGQQLGAKPKPFIGTGAWLIKQVPLGQKAAGAGFYSVCQSVPGWLEGTLQHTKERGDATLRVFVFVFFSPLLFQRSNAPRRSARGCCCLGYLDLQISESKDRSGMCVCFFSSFLLSLTHILPVKHQCDINPHPEQAPNSFCFSVAAAAAGERRTKFDLF